MSEVATRVDVTENVGKFFREPRKGGEVATTLPGLVVVAARDSLIRVSAKRHDMDGCHPVKWAESREAQETPVTVLRRFGQGSWVGANHLGTVTFDRGFDRFVDEGFLDDTEFYVDPDYIGEQLEASTGLNEEIKGPKSFVAVKASDLVGDDEELVVRPRDPLKTPLTIPVQGDYGETWPAYNTPVNSLSAVTVNGVKQLVLAVRRPLHDSIQLGPVSVDDVEFAIRMVEHTPEWLIGQIRRYEGQDIEKQKRYIDEINKVLIINDKPIYFRPIFESNKSPASRRTLAVGHEGEHGITYSLQEYDFWDRTSYELRRVIKNADGVFAVDGDANVALALSDVYISEYRPL